MIPFPLRPRRSRLVLAHLSVLCGLLVALAALPVASPRPLHAQSESATATPLTERPVAGAPSAPATQDRLAVEPLLTDQHGGASFSVDAEGPLAVVGVGMRAHVLQIDGDGLRWLGQTPILGSLVRAVTVVSDTAYVGVSDMGGIHVFDLSDPAVPVETAFVPTAGEVRNFDVGEDRVYAAVLGGVKALDRDPEGGLRERDLDLPYRAVAALRVLGDHLYVLEPGIGLHAVDVTGDDARPGETLELEEDMALDATADMIPLGEDRLLVVVGNVIYVVDVSDPDAPALLARAPAYGLAVDAALDPSGRRLAVANVDGGVRLVDVTDPLAMRELEALDSEQGVSSVAWSEAGLLWTDWLTGLRLSPSAGDGRLAPRDPHRATSFADGVAWAGADRLYATASLAGLDVLGRDDATGALVWEAEEPLDAGVRSTRIRRAPGAGWLAVLGPHGGLWGMREAADGSLARIGSPLRITAHDGSFSEDGARLFVAGGFEGFHELSFSDAGPDRTATLPSSSFVGGIDRVGDLAALSSREEGLVLVDVGTPGAPRILSATTAAGPAMDVALRGDRAYVATQEGLLEVFDVSDPTSPASLRVLPLGGGVLKLEWAPDSGRLYALVDEHTLVPIDLASPDEPQVGQAYAFPERINDVALADGLGWVTLGRYGIVELPMPFEPRAEPIAMPTARPTPAPTSAPGTAPAEGSVSGGTEAREPGSTRTMVLAILAVVALAAAAIALVVRAGRRGDDGGDTSAAPEDAGAGDTPAARQDESRRD